MRATNFEVRHAAILHLVLVGVSLVAYWFDPDDIVWALVRNGSHPRLMERLLFAVATLLIGAGAALRTWASAHRASNPGSGSSASFAGVYRYTRYPELLGSLLFAIGLAFLTPLWGAIFLVCAEAVLVFRLIQREKDHPLAITTASGSPFSPDHAPAAFDSASPAWGTALRHEAGKWGVFVTMVVFTFLLRDRVAETLALLSVLVWLALNCGFRGRISN